MKSQGYATREQLPRGADIQGPFHPLTINLRCLLAQAGPPLPTLSQRVAQGSATKFVRDEALN